MPRFQVVLLAGAALLVSAGAAQAADPQWHTTIVEMPDGSDIEIQYVGDIEPRVRVAMPVVQGASPPAVESTGTPIAYGGIPRARRMIQPPVAAVPQYAPQYAQGYAIPGGAQPQAAPQFVIAGDQPKGSTYEYTLITTGADGKVCSQRTEWTSQGKNKEPRVKRVDSGEGCAGLIAPPPAAPQYAPAPQAASPRIVPVDPSSI